MKEGLQGLRRFAAIALYALLAAALVLNLAGALLDIWAINASAALTRIDQYEVRSALLQEAMEYVGPCSAPSAAQIWAQGVQRRSGALQYSAMGTALKSQYAAQLSQGFPNWVTGMSSPWVDGFSITPVKPADPAAPVYNVCFDTMTSAGPAGQLQAVLTLRQEGDYWRITGIQADPDLYPYLGFTP